MYLRTAVLAAIVPAIAAFAQNPITADSPFQVRYAANLNIGESYINIVNTGANGAPLLGPGFGAASGNICVNVYAFSSDEQLVSCCSCFVTPNAVVNLGVNRDLTVKTLTGVVPSSVTVKLVATLAGAGGTGGASSCNSSAATVLPPVVAAGAAALTIRGAAQWQDPGGTIETGMAAWGTTLHATPAGAYATTETPFTPSSLSPGELASITGRCASILGNGSGFGICGSCRTGALGSSKLGM